MRALDRFEPFAVLIYFACVTGCAMFMMHPVLIALSLMGAFALWFTRNGFGHMRSHLIYLVLFIVMTLINPLTHHNGVTVLLVINDNPVTLEALIYGAVASAMIIGVMYWFRCFSQIMTSDKLLYIFGRLSPRIALVLSMALRYVPRLSAQAKKINGAQKTLGLYREDNVIDAARGGMRVFSILVTWALENGITTADSMAARGYGAGRRSFYAIYHMRKADIAAIIVSLALMCALIALRRYAAFAFYPALDTIGINAGSLALYGLYALLAFAPTLVELGEGLKWHCLRSRI